MGWFIPQRHTSRPGRSALGFLCTNINAGIPRVTEPTIRRADLNSDCGELEPSYLELSLVT